MNYADYRISLDVRSIGSHVALECKKRETKIRIYAVLTEGVKPYTISENCTAVFTAKKPDGNILFNDCVIEDNTIIYTFTQQTTTAVGVMDCEIRLYGPNGGLLISANFRVLVHDAVYDDDDVVESATEVNTLTSLISEANELINSVNSKLDNGDFIPKLSIGTVETLPAGSNARVTLTGTREAPVLNFGIPQGDEGQAEGLIPDTELSTESTKPVQNRAIAEAINALAQNTAEAITEATTTFSAAIEKVDSDNTESLNALAEEVADKVEKETGKGLSTNDFTNAYKEKLDGIEAGANKYTYTLPVGGNALGGVKNGGDIAIDSSGNMTIKDGAVTTDKIVKGAVSQAYTATLLTANWGTSNGYYYQDLTVSGLSTVMQTTILDADTSAITAANVIYQVDAIDEAFGLVIKGYIRQENNYRVWAKDIPDVDIPIKITVVMK